MIYFIADTHFGHEAAIEFSNRPFRDAAEMNFVMMANWNARVKPDDDIYIVGDFWFQGGHRYNHEVAMDFIRKLNGNKYLVIGNHDKRPLSYPEFSNEFVDIADIMKIKHDGQRVILCHYPMLEWEGGRREAWHIHGHIHGRKEDTFHCLRNMERALNAGAEIVGYMPVTFEELVQYNAVHKSTVI